jgi:4-aminobutyrate aminotransferase-like enzyme
MDVDHPPIEHAGESQSNDVRRRLSRAEPKGLRTYTPSLAVVAKSAGCYHWTPEGRKLADFTSGVLVANLGHNPVRWWQRVWRYLQLPDLASVTGAFAPMIPLTSYNAATQLEVECCERLLANMRAQPGGGRMEQVLWAASGSEAIQKSLWAAMRVTPGRDMVHTPRLPRQEGTSQRRDWIGNRPGSRPAHPFHLVSDRRVL